MSSKRDVITGAGLVRCLAAGIHDRRMSTPRSSTTGLVDALQKHI